MKVSPVPDWSWTPNFLNLNLCYMYLQPQTTIRLKMVHIVVNLADLEDKTVNIVKAIY